MFKQLFSTMNEVLDELLRDYHTAQGPYKKQLDEQLLVLKSMSDECIENWLIFEEKLGRLICNDSANSSLLHENLPQPDVVGKKKVEFLRGQGYYKLFMYDQAIVEFETLLRQEPDFLLARVYLAMGYLRKGELPEAYRQFKFLLPLTENLKVKAISYNVMGCIETQNHNLEQAYELFKKAYYTDASCMEPYINLDEST